MSLQIKSLKLFLIHNIYGILWAFLIFILCITSGKKLPKAAFFSFDKVLHASFYFVFIILLLYGFKKQYSYPKLRFNSDQYALLVAGSYGLIIEYIQPIISDRVADFSDFLANLVGCVFGWITFKIIYKL